MLTPYLLLAFSIATEMIATSTLPATEGFTKLKPSIVSIIGYILCFYSVGHALMSLDLGIAYATWGAVGSIVTPIVGYFFYQQKITKIGVVALVLIIASVLVLNLYG